MGAAFSLGIGSPVGHNYAVEINMVTLAHIPQEVEKAIKTEVGKMLKKGIKKEFPDRMLSVVYDKNMFRIYGDLGLGSI